MKKQDKQNYLKQIIVETQKNLSFLKEQEAKAYSLYCQYKEQVEELKKQPHVERFDRIANKYIDIRKMLRTEYVYSVSPQNVEDLLREQNVYKMQLKRLHSDKDVKKYIRVLRGKKEIKELCLFLTKAKYKCEKCLKKAQKKLEKLIKNQTFETYSFE